MTDRFLIIVSLLGMMFLMFVAGNVSMYFHLSPSVPIADSITAVQAWNKARQEPVYVPSSQAAGDSAAPGSVSGDLLRQAQINWDKAKAFNGYTLISMRSFTDAYLIDMDGHIAHRWSMPFQESWLQSNHVHGWTHAHIFMERVRALPNGDLIAQYSGFGDTPYGYGIAKLDKDSKVLWMYNENAHHDFYIDQENGNIYGLIHSVVQDPIKGIESLHYPTLADYIVTLSPEGKELSRISILEAFRDSPFSEMLNYNTKSEKWDHLHTNSVMKLEPAIAKNFPMFKAGQILISMREMNGIAVIDPSSRKVVWAYKGGWVGQHAAVFLSNGHIMVYDNRGEFSGGQTFSRIVEFDPKTLETVWHFSGSEDQPFFSRIHGFLQRLPNGDTMIPETMKSRIIEVTNKGEIVWSYKLPAFKGGNGLPNGILTALRYAPEDLPFLKNTEHGF